MPKNEKLQSFSFKPLYSLLHILLFVVFLLIQTGCAKQIGQYPCGANECFGQDIWQQSIDRIAAHNFPEEHYYGKVYADQLNNAWTTDDNNVNISEDLLTHLAAKGDTYVLSVSAHEIAHIRSHHYARKSSLSHVSTLGSPSSSPFSYSTRKYKAMLSRQHELEADILAVQYMVNAGYEREDYLNFLQWMEGNMKDAPHSDLATHPPIRERIARIEQLETSAETVSKQRKPGF